MREQSTNKAKQPDQSRQPDQAKQPELSLKDLILSFQDWCAFLWSKWLVILIVGLLGGAVGLLVAVLQKPTYVARLTFVLEDEKGGGGMGNLGGLAAMAGINLGSGGGGLFQGENILDLYHSRRMISQSLLSSSATNDSLLIERYLDFSGLREDWAKRDRSAHLAALNFKEPENFTLRHDSIMGEVVEKIQEAHLTVKRPDKQKSLIEVKVISEDEGFSRDFTEVLVREVNEFYIQTKTKKSQQNLDILTHQVDSVRQELDAALAGMAASMDANPNPNPARMVLSVGSSRRQVDAQANQAILSELVKNQELAKVTLRDETPLIQVVDRPHFPLEKLQLGVLKGVLIGGLLAGFLIVGLLVIGRYYRRVMDDPS